MLQYKGTVGQDLLEIAEGSGFSIEFYDHEIRVEHTSGLGVSLQKAGGVGGVPYFGTLLDLPTDRDYYTSYELGVLSWLCDAARVIENDILSTTASLESLGATG